MMEKPKDLRSNPQIPYQEIRLLWFVDYWDGPLSGVCFYRGQRYWFEAIEPEKDNYGYPRTMGVYILSAEELQAEEESQRRFQQYVGMHTTYDDPENRSAEEVLRPGEDHEKFYSWYKKQPKRDYRHNEMVGWFCHRRRKCEPILARFDSMTQGEKPAQINDNLLKRKNNHFFLCSKSTHLSSTPAHIYVGANTLNCKLSLYCAIPIIEPCFP